MPFLSRRRGIVDGEEVGITNTGDIVLTELSIERITMTYILFRLS